MQKAKSQAKRNRAARAGMVALAVVGSAALSGCVGPTIITGDQPLEPPVVDFTGVEPADEITFWSNHPGASIDFEREVIANFEAETGIKVNLVTAGASYPEVAQKFQTAQISGDAGDLVVLSDATWFPAYLNGSIIALDTLFEAADISTDGYWPALYEDYLYEGYHFAVPYARSTPLFFYNKEHYAAAGLEDKAPETWEEFREVSQTLADANLGAAPFGYPPEANYPAWSMSNLVWGYGGAWSDEWDLNTISDPNTVEAVTFAQNLVKDKLARVLSGPPSTDFAAGAVSQTVDSTGTLGGILDTASFEVGVGFLPLGPTGDTQVVPTGGAGVAIASKSSPERQLAAGIFATYLTNAENTAKYSALTGYLPVQQDADMTEVYEEKPQFETAVNQLSRARSQDWARVFLPGGDLAIGKGLVKVLTTNTDVQSEMEETETSLKALFDRDLARLLGADQFGD